MPVNKNAVLRYKYIDELLSDKHHYYDMTELVDAINKRLNERGYNTVSRRTVEKDLSAIEYEIFDAEIKRFNYKGKRCLTYEKPGFSIFHKSLTDEETNLLGEVLATLGEFEGLPHFTWLESLQKGLGIKKHKSIISFSQNVALKNLHFLGMLYDTISNQQVLELHYQQFTSSEEETLKFHPYLLKEYNNRWFLVGFDETNHLLKTLALDRIQNFAPIIDCEYVSYPGDIKDFFKNAIGITVYDKIPPSDILLWANDLETYYIDSKPIHSSQHKITDANINIYLQKKYQKTNGSFYKLRCQDTYELERELISHFSAIEVLESPELRENIKKKINEMQKLYQ